MGIVTIISFSLRELLVEYGRFPIATGFQTSGNLQDEWKAIVRSLFMENGEDKCSY